MISRYLMDTVRSYLQRCPARTVLEALASKWTLLVLSSLYKHGGTMRFNEIRRHLEGVTQKMLTQTLRALERDGLVSRTVYPTVPPKVEYTATEMARELHDSLAALVGWAERHRTDIAAARAAYDRRPADPAA